MYLTAQRVVSRDGRTGINVFFHLHKYSNPPKLINDSDVISVAESNTGELVKERCNITPGGNRVKSYLDIVASDEIDEQELITALNSFRSDIVEEKMGPILRIIGKVGLRFNAEFGLYDTIVDEYKELKEKALSLFQQRA